MNNFAQTVQPFFRIAFAVMALTLVAACMKTPSEKYNLAPPNAQESYPQFAAPREHKRALPTAEEQQQIIRNLEVAAQRQGQISGTQLRVRGVNGQ